LFAFGMTGAWAARHVGVSEMTVSRWYRGVRRMEAKHALLLTKLLRQTIEKAESALAGNGMPDTWRTGMAHKLETARGWCSLQEKLNAAPAAEDWDAELARCF
jgi:siderophore synthetase component